MDLLLRNVSSGVLPHEHQLVTALHAVVCSPCVWGGDGLSERRFAGIFLLLLLHAVACFFCVQSLSFDGLLLVSSRICCLCFWGHNRKAVSKLVSGSFARTGLRIRWCPCSCSSHCCGAAGSIPGWGTSTCHGCRKKQTNKQTSQGRRSSFSSLLFLHFYGVSPEFNF